MDLKQLPAITVRLGDLVSAPRNSNIMPRHKFEALKKFIERSGVAQECVVRAHPELDGKWEIVDGHHRRDAYVELGYSEDTEIPCRDASLLSDAEAVELTLSLNNNRGELDLGLVVQDLEFLREAGRTLDDLTITGFRPAELEALLKPLEDLTEEDLVEQYAEVTKEKEEPAPKVFSVDIPCRSGEEVTEIKKMLRRAGGKGNKDLGKGLRALLGIEE